MDRQGQGAYIPQELLKELSKASNRLLIGIPCERVEGERRLALTPEAVDMLTDRGHRVLVEAGAGLGINYSDNHYSEAGAEIVATPAEVYQADIVLKILPPLTAEVMMMKPRTTLFSTVQFNTFSHEAFELMMAKRITAVAYELLADDKQRCPVLNVISEIEGTASITIASELLSNTQGGKGILLGGIPGVSPTEVVIIGAGNAGDCRHPCRYGTGCFREGVRRRYKQASDHPAGIGARLVHFHFPSECAQNAFRSADVVIGAMRYINTRHRYIIAEDMIRIMKRGALVIDLRINQGGCFETTCCLCPSDPAVFEQYGVLHYCRQNISNRVARTTSMALSNIFVPMLFLLGDAGAVQGMIKSDPGFKNGVYMYCGKPVNSYVSNRFGLSSNNIDLYLSAF